MPDALFVKHPDFPRGKCDFTPAGDLLRMKVREWAFAKVNLENVSPARNVDSNNPTKVPGRFDTAEKKIQTKMKTADTIEVEFFAYKPGFTYIDPVNLPPHALTSAQLQVQVIDRKATAKDFTDISLTKLEGKTVAINASDAKTYEMDTTALFAGIAQAAAVNPLAVLTAVPSGANHVVLSSHGGYVRGDTRIWMFIGGFNDKAARIDNDNVESIFATLKGKVAADCVIWFGGCTIGS